MNVNFFKAQDMLNYYRNLPSTKHFGKFELDIPDKVAIMTHDDRFDWDMHNHEQEIGATSTFFALSYKIKTSIPKSAEVHLHYNKGYRKEDIKQQVKTFKKLLGYQPMFNRNHKLWWRENHFDLAHLAMNGILVDCTTIGWKPYRLCVEGKILPIWELPTSICDMPWATADRKCWCTYNLFSTMEETFKRGITPITGLFHPYFKDRTDWRGFFSLADKYGYNIMNVSQFYEKYLKNAGPKEARP